MPFFVTLQIERSVDNLVADITCVARRVVHAVLVLSEVSCRIEGFAANVTLDIFSVLVHCRVLFQ